MQRGDVSFKGVLKLRGVPFQATVDDVKDFFRGYGVATNGIYITSGVDGRATGKFAA